MVTYINSREGYRSSLAQLKETLITIAKEVTAMTNGALANAAHLLGCMSMRQYRFVFNAFEARSALTTCSLDLRGCPLQFAEEIFYSVRYINERARQIEREEEKQGAAGSDGGNNAARLRKRSTMRGSRGGRDWAPAVPAQHQATPTAASNVPLHLRTYNFRGARYERQGDEPSAWLHGARR